MSEQQQKTMKQKLSAGAIALGLVVSGVGMLLDGNPDTNPDYAEIVQAMEAAGLVSAAIAATILGFITRKKK